MACDLDLNHLPDGITLEALDQYAAAKERERRRKYRQEHPEKMLNQRTVACKNFLTRNGYIVIKAGPEPLPDFDLEDVPEAVRAAMQRDPVWSGDFMTVICLYKAMQQAQKAVGSNG